ncbi:hypothetical protein GS535_03360 [Saccharibacter sp. EH611]|nr:hypothetical protein [Saccharibacter sp. EH611]MXV58861.1 hypothetical protein [Saccharibacter sp. EH70]MXV65517.1 hypothetical protein [Saccharibacter sp. EH60]
MENHFMKRSFLTLPLVIALTTSAAISQSLPPDDHQNVASLQSAADQGNSDAQLKLGIMYFNGQEVPQNEAKAAEWFQKSADQGDENAQKALKALFR